MRAESWRGHRGRKTQWEPIVKQRKEVRTGQAVHLVSLHGLGYYKVVLESTVVRNPIFDTKLKLNPKPIKDSLTKPKLNLFR